MPAWMRRIDRFCRDCRYCATYEVLDMYRRVDNIYCKLHAEERVRQLDAEEKARHDRQTAPRPTCHMEDLERGQEGAP